MTESAGKTRVRIAPGAEVADDVSIADGVIIGPEVKIESGCIIAAEVEVRGEDHHRQEHQNFNRSPAGFSTPAPRAGW